MFLKDWNSSIGLTWNETDLGQNIFQSRSRQALKIGLWPKHSRKKSPNLEKKEEFENDLNSFKIPTIHHLSANFFGRSSLIGFCNHFTFLWFPTAFSLHFINFANFLPDWLSSPTLQKLEDFAQIDKWKELKHKAVQKVKE